MIGGREKLVLRTSGVRHTDLKYLKSFKEGEDSKFQDIGVIQEKTKGSLARDAIEKIKSGGVTWNCSSRLQRTLRVHLKLPRPQQDWSDLRPLQVFWVVTMERMLYGEDVTLSKVYGHTMNWKKQCQFHECQINVSETLTRSQLRGYNKNQSLILSPLASARFVSMGEVFPLTWIRIPASPLTCHRPWVTALQSL